MRPEDKERIRNWILDFPDKTEIQIWKEDNFWIGEVANVFVVGFEASEVFDELADAVRMQ